MINTNIRIDCKDKSVECILGRVGRALDDKNDGSDVGFINLDVLKIEELKKINEKLEYLYNTLRVSVTPFFINEKADKCYGWRMRSILNLNKQVEEEIQIKEKEQLKDEKFNRYNHLNTKELSLILESFKLIYYKVDDQEQNKLQLNIEVIRDILKYRKKSL